MSSGHPAPSIPRWQPHSDGAGSPSSDPTAPSGSTTFSRDRAVPTSRSVDEVARLALWAGRDGGSVVLSEVSPELDELLELSGLRVEMRWQAEGGEETLVVEQVEEEAHPGDLPA